MITVGIRATYHVYASVAWSILGVWCPAREDWIDRSDAHWALAEELMDELESKYAGQP